MTFRERIESIQESTLSVYASLPKNSSGRDCFEDEDDFRTCYQRDRDRIIHSKAFRRLKHKTQVFFSPEGDHYRTRLTHTLEVSQIARTISRALFLNEDLTEAIALGHDLGHTPFGHAGEHALNEIVKGGFEHSSQSLRVVEKLEKKNGSSYLGLNLTKEVKDGILNHSFGCQSFPSTLEGQVVRLSDKIAYVNHDFDDAYRAGILVEEDIPFGIREVLGKTQKERLNTLVSDVIENSFNRNEILQSQTIRNAMVSLRGFMFDNVYNSAEVKTESDKASKIVLALYNHFFDSGDIDLSGFSCSESLDDRERQVSDYIAGMTDAYAINEWTKIFGLKSWSV